MTIQPTVVLECGSHNLSWKIGLRLEHLCASLCIAKYSVSETYIKRTLQQERTIYAAFEAGRRVKHLQPEVLRGKWKTVITQINLWICIVISGEDKSRLPGALLAIASHDIGQQKRKRPWSVGLNQPPPSLWYQTPTPYSLTFQSICLSRSEEWSAYLEHTFLSSNKYASSDRPSILGVTNVWSAESAVRNTGIDTNMPKKGFLALNCRTLDDRLAWLLHHANLDLPS